MSEQTFRDFAGHIMRGDAPAAASVLEALLGLDAATARAATEHFRGRMPEPAFMPKAMGLRTALASGSDGEITALLAECFGLDAASQASGLAALRRR
jgi:phosphoserine phosphatase